MTTSLSYGDQLEFESQASDHIRCRPNQVADAERILSPARLEATRSGIAQQLSRRSRPPSFPRSPIGRMRGR